ncbi:MAG: hypothetical protein ABIB97_03455 [Patescibacteria group bacterium]
MEKSFDFRPIKLPPEEENLIFEIYEIIKDYRADDVVKDKGTSVEQIRNWIIQFNENDRDFILSEMKNILEKRYYSKGRTKIYLKSIIQKIARDYDYISMEKFLKETYFLYLHKQKENMSQNILNKLVGDILIEEYNISIDDCGSRIKKNFIFLDDVLATGNTLYYEIKPWLEENNKFYLNKLLNRDITLSFVYIFIHQYNRKKKENQLKKLNIKIKNSKVILSDKYYNWYYAEEIVDDIVKPIEKNISDLVLNYQKRIEELVDEYTYSKVPEWSNNKVFERSKPEFYRFYKKDSCEKLFTSVENRIRFEKIILEKGIKIINSWKNIDEKNCRALGYPVPSHKNFGFGALCFSWNNIPNNCPVVFWNDDYPLFKRRN